MISYKNIFLKWRDDEILVKKLGDAKKKLSETLGLYVSIHVMHLHVY